MSQDLDLGIIVSSSSLVLQSVRRESSGEYTCTAKNEAGSKSETALLKVNGKNCELYKVTGRQKSCGLLKMFCIQV